jgi:hypothetical protein
MLVFQIEAWLCFPFGSVELGRPEVGGEGHHLAQVLRCRDDRQRLARRHARYVLVDDELARGVHRLAVAGEGAVEVGRMVRFDARDDLVFARRRIDLVRDRATLLVVVGELLLADLEDVIRRQAIEGAQADQLVVLCSAERERVRRAGQLAADGVGVIGQRRAGPLGCPLQAANDRAVVPRGTTRCGDHLAEEGRQ